MVATETEIVNLGLDLIGEAPVTDILAPGNERATVAARQYYAARDALLRAHLWTFARKWVALTVSSTATLDVERPYQYPLPAECVRVIRPNTVHWVVRGRTIYWSESAALSVEIVQNGMTVPEFDPCFVEALAARIVLRMVERRTQSANKQQVLRQHYRDAIDEAIRAGAVEVEARDMFADTDSNYLAGRWGDSAVT